MNHDYILRVALQVLVYEIAALHQQLKCWTVVVLPLIGHNFAVERRGIVLNSAQIANEIVVAVLLLEELADLRDVVSVDLLDEIRGWEAHGDDAGCDVGQVQIVLALLEPDLVSCDELSN